MILFQSAVLELAKEIEYICTEDPSHRIDIYRHSGLALLAKQINSLVGFYQDIKLEERGAQQKLIASTGEKQTLTALMSQLPQGIGMSVLLEIRKKVQRMHTAWFKKQSYS